MYLRKRLAVAAALLLGAGIAVVPATAASAGGGEGGDGTPDKVISAYFADWDVYGRGYFVKDIPANKINVIQYAFGNPTFDPATNTPGCAILDPWADYQQPYGTDNSVDGVADDAANLDQHVFGNFNQLLKLKKKHPGLRILWSFGGCT